jgi:type III pantothenate kinase
MILLIDVGNSRIKWRLTSHDGSAQSAEICTHDDVEPLATCLENPAIRRVLGSNVARHERAEALDALAARRGLTLEWITSSAQCCGVRNLYEHPAQLGTDRWAALIGARALYPHTALVVMVGTAITVDVLYADGQFAGGLILPGVGLMRQALDASTARLPPLAGHYREMPRSTADAIVSGCLDAQAGAVERMFRRIGDARARCLLSGGGAGEIAPLLDIPLQRVENLVLDGLYRIARETWTT